jgi:predicted ester cyclase
VSSQESNVERMRYFIEQVQEGGRFELIDELVHPGFRNRTIGPGQRDGLAGVHDFMTALHEAFSDLRIEILHCVGDGDLVATHKMFRGWYTGPWFGAPPSGEFVEFRVMDVIRFQEGQLIEHWAVIDAMRPSADADG